MPEYQTELELAAGPAEEGKKERKRVPTIVTPSSSLVPTEVYDTYWEFAAERQEIFFRRAAGAPAPWTEDPILRVHKFTNAYRASDRVSQYLIRQVIYSGDPAPREVFFRIMLFKLFNKIETWELFLERVGPPLWADFHFQLYDRVLTEAFNAGVRIYSAAYIMPSARMFGHHRKHSNHLALIELMMRKNVAEQLQESRLMSEGYELLRSFPSLGNFLAYQLITDINYSTLTNYNEMEFVIPGPGARDGIRKCFKDIGSRSEADVIRMMAERQSGEFARLDLDFRTLWGRPLQLIDCQNLFCEVDKYARVAHPNAAGLTGRTRIKQKYRATPNPIRYWYPPKWNLNETIEREQRGAE